MELEFELRCAHPSKKERKKPLGADKARNEIRESQREENLAGGFLSPPGISI